MEPALGSGAWCETEALLILFLEASDPFYCLELCLSTPIGDPGGVSYFLGATMRNCDSQYLIPGLLSQLFREKCFSNLPSGKERTLGQRKGMGLRRLYCMWLDYPPPISHTHLACGLITPPPTPHTHTPHNLVPWAPPGMATKLTKNISPGLELWSVLSSAPVVVAFDQFRDLRSKDVKVLW